MDTIDRTNGTPGKISKVNRHQCIYVLLSVNVTLRAVFICLEMLSFCMIGSVRTSMTKLVIMLRNVPTQIMSACLYTCHAVLPVGPS